MKHYTREDFEKMSINKLLQKLLSRQVRYRALRNKRYIIASDPLSDPGSTLDLIHDYNFKGKDIDKNDLIEKCWQAQQRLEAERRDSMNESMIIKKIDSTLLRIAYLQKDSSDILPVNLVPARFHTRDRDGRDLLDRGKLKSTTRAELLKVLVNLKNVLRTARMGIENSSNNKILKGASSRPMTPGQLAAARDHILQAVPVWTNAALAWDREWHAGEPARRAAQERFIGVVRKISELPDLKKEYISNVIEPLRAKVNDESAVEDALNVLLAQRNAILNPTTQHLQQKAEVMLDDAKVMLDDFVKNFGLDALEAATDTFAILAQPASEIQKPPIQKYLEDNGLSFDDGMIKHAATGYSVEVDKAFICSISHELMLDPVMVTSNGQTYDRLGITEWFIGHATDPTTNKVCSKTLVPNFAFRHAIEGFLERVVADAKATQEPGHSSSKMRR